MHGGVESIEPYVEHFIDFAFAHPDYTFLVTKIGCGIAAFTPYEMAPLFIRAIDVENVILPKEFVEIISNYIVQKIQLKIQRGSSSYWKVQ